MAKKVTFSEAKEIVGNIDPKAVLSFDASGHELKVVSEEMIREIFSAFLWKDNVISYDSQHMVVVTAFSSSKAIEECKSPPAKDWLWERNNQQGWFPGGQEAKDYVGRND